MAFLKLNFQNNMIKITILFIISLFWFGNIYLEVSQANTGLSGIAEIENKSGNDVITLGGGVDHLPKDGENAITITDMKKKTQIFIGQEAIKNDKGDVVDKWGNSPIKIEGNVKINKQGYLEKNSKLILNQSGSTIPDGNYIDKKGKVSKSKLSNKIGLDSNGDQTDTKSDVVQEIQAFRNETTRPVILMNRDSHDVNDNPNVQIREGQLFAQDNADITLKNIDGNDLKINSKNVKISGGIRIDTRDENSNIMEFANDNSSRMHIDNIKNDSNNNITNRTKLVAQDKEFLFMSRKGVNSDPLHKSNSRDNLGELEHAVVMKKYDSTLPNNALIGEYRITEENGNYKTKEIIRRFDIPVGSVLWYIGKKIPEGYLLADGSEIEETQYPLLYKVLESRFKKNNKVYLPDIVTGQKFIRSIQENKSTGVGDVGHLHHGNILKNYEECNVSHKNNLENAGCVCTANGKNDQYSIKCSCPPYLDGSVDPLTHCKKRYSCIVDNIYGKNTNLACNNTEYTDYSDNNLSSNTRANTSRTYKQCQSKGLVTDPPFIGKCQEIPQYVRVDSNNRASKINKVGLPRLIPNDMAVDEADGGYVDEGRFYDYNESIYSGSGGIMKFASMKPIIKY